MSKTDSGLDFDELQPEGSSSGELTIVSPSGFWLNGDVVACACPDCGFKRTTLCRLDSAR